MRQPAHRTLEKYTKTKSNGSLLRRCGFFQLMCRSGDTVGSMAHVLAVFNFALFCRRRFEHSRTKGALVSATVVAVRAITTCKTVTSCTATQECGCLKLSAERAKSPRMPRSKNGMNERNQSSNVKVRTEKQPCTPHAKGRQMFLSSGPTQATAAATAPRV